MSVFQIPFNLESRNSADTADNSHRTLKAAISTCLALHTTLTPPEYLSEGFPDIYAYKVLSPLHITKLHQELPN